MSTIFLFLDFQFLPRELLEMILLESMVGIMSVEWMTNVRDNESVSGSYNLYKTVANKSWMSAYKSLKSVTNQWIHARFLNRRYQKRGVVLKQCEFHEFSKQFSVLYLHGIAQFSSIYAFQKAAVLSSKTS